ncbi:MAG: phosphodiester glycosidase family protein [Thermoflexales bacterium]
MTSMRGRGWLGLLVSLLLAACATPVVTLIPAATITASPATRTPAARQTPTAVAQPPIPTAPISVRPGIEIVVVPLVVTGIEAGEILVVARIDPAKVDVRVRYAPKQPRAVHSWLTDEVADIVINAGYFTQDNLATGLLIADGALTGQTYRGFGGLFAVRAGPPATLSLQWLKEQPYVADRKITQAVESFPMLVRNGKVVDGINDDGRRNRRSFVALDKSGRLLLGVSRYASLTLTDLAAALAGQPALGIDAALNLDGGASSGLGIRAPGDALSIESFDEVPAVITVTGRK